MKNTIVGVNSVPTTLLQAGIEELKRLEKRSVEINSRSTYRQSIIFQKCLKEYVLTFGKEDYPFSEVTEQFGLSYKVFLMKNINQIIIFKIIENNKKVPIDNSNNIPSPLPSSLIGSKWKLMLDN